MDNSRRSFDRSRQTGVKKPRLAEPTNTPADRNSNGRKFPQRPATVAATASVSGSRLSERSEPVNEPYEPQELQVPHQEIVSQYRTALAELTVNSKPIITNLTIIAGENSHAAKGIAATICKNIIEVPRDQKLPSLYLLDSIVKNLGKDYIKHFAPKLPEVFCKTYKQVDPSIHSGMRHLFGTWKGVFPLRTLQLIEKELGFGTGVNGSSSSGAAASTRPDSQAQRPASIHVNPKYLRLPQTTRAKDNLISGIESPEDITDVPPSRTSSVTSGRQRVDPIVKNIRNPVRDKKIATSYGETEYSYDLPRRGEGRVTEKVNEQEFEKTWYDSENISNQRNNGVNVKRGYQNYIAQKAASLEALVHSKPEIETSKSWKNTEEEEYSWDDMSSKSIGYGKVSTSVKDQWIPDDSEGLDYEMRFRKPQSTQEPSRSRSRDSLSSPEVERDEEGFGHAWAQETPHRTGTTNKRSSPSSESYPRLSSIPDPRGRNHFQSQSEPVNNIKNSDVGSTRPVYQRPLHSFPEHEIARRTDFRQPSIGSHDQFSQRSSVKPTFHPHRSIKQVNEPLETHIPGFGDSPESESSGLLPHVNHGTKKSLTMIKKPLPEISSPHIVEESPRQSTASSLLAAVMKSGIFGTDSGPGPSVTPVSVPSPASSNPMSSLISSLVSKGLITASKPDPQIPSISKKPRYESASKSSSSENKIVIKSDSLPVEIKNLIGFEFRADIIRELHTEVIEDLFNDLTHLCNICGLQFKLKERLDRHLEWHELKSLEHNSVNKLSRKWYVNSVSSDSLEDSEEIICEEEEEIDDQQMVPADETQYVCVLCGEVFEDYYNQENNQWMFKGAVYLSNSSTNIVSQGPIVHSTCTLHTSDSNLGLA